MESIRIEKENFQDLLANYNWETLGNQKNDSRYANSFRFTQTTMSSVLYQFSREYILSNDAIWGDYNDQKILVSRAPGIFDLLKEKNNTDNFPLLIKH